MLYYIMWDHHKNWQELSDERTLNFLFQQLNDLAEVEVDGVRLNWWVGKLLEEIIVDNMEANKLLESRHIMTVVNRLVLDGEKGRTQYVAILKSIVEDEVQPLPIRQEEVIEALQRVADPEHLREIDPTASITVDQVKETVLLYYQDANNDYRLESVLSLYSQERDDALRRGLTVEPDALPNPEERSDADLNYPLQLVDLLGMCAKARKHHRSEDESAGAAPE
jgi:hypothetical protein